ncbi:MAG: ATP-dependent metallopeptidase FtsH/Yme1/Tma family protein, partial [Bacteroidaceae bacterium]|nr:ATP-dependent metallopeptidase FtsH/Yme1/Tma family protein [Bacteroidaceae bacterium]
MDNKKEQKPKVNLNWLYILILAGLAYALFSNNGGSSSKETSWTQFKAYVHNGYAKNIVADKKGGNLRMYVTNEHIREIFGVSPQQIGTDNAYLTTEYPTIDALERFVEKEKAAKRYNGSITYERNEDYFTMIWQLILPALFFFGVYFFFIRRMGGGAGGG